MERIIDLLLTLLPGSILLLQTLIGKIMLANNLTLSRNASEKAMAPHSSTLAWKIHGQRSLVGYSPWGREESDRTERLHFHFSLSCLGEGNGNPLQCSCLENPRDGEAWWAAVHWVAQNRTQLKRLSILVKWTNFVALPKKKKSYTKGQIPEPHYHLVEG